MQCSIPLFHMRHAKFPHLGRSKPSDPVVGGRKEEGTKKWEELRAREKRKDRVKSSNKRELEYARVNRKSQKEVNESMTKEETSR